MPITDWDTSIARKAGTVVRVGGVERSHAHVVWGQDLASAMPEQVSAAGGFGHRTGTITWHREGVSANLPSPWSTAGGWVPKVDEPVTVDAVDGKGNTVRVFTGVIDTVDGDIDGGMVSEIVDRVDDFNRIARVEALTEIGAPWKADGTKRYSGASALWTINEVARQCGYYSTPPPPSGLILDAPMHGSTYVYAEQPTYANAQMTSSGGLTGQFPNPQFTGGGDYTGVALRDAKVQYIPYSGGGSGENQLRVSMIVHPNHKDPASIHIVKANGSEARLSVDGNKAVRVSTARSGAHMTGRTVFQLGWSTDIIVVSAIFRGDNVDVETSNGKAATVALHTPIGAVATMDVEAGYQAAISGVQVSDPGTSGGHVATSWQPSAIIRYGWHAWLQRITPSIRDENAGEVLKEFSEALLTPAYLDEYGVLRVTGSDDLHYKRAEIMVDMVSTIADMTWSARLRDVRDRVEIEWSDVSVSMNLKTPDPTVILHQGSTATFSEEETDLEEIIEVPDDEEWLGRDVTLGDLNGDAWIYRYYPTPTFDQFNQGIGSAYGAMTSNRASDDTQSEKFAHIGLYDESYRVLSPWALRRNVKSLASYVTKVPEHPGISRKYWGMGLPVIRGTGKVKRKKATMVRDAGKGGRRPLRLPMGRWCTQDGLAREFRDWIYGQVTAPHPIVTGLVIRFDPRVNVGSKIMIDSRQLHGVAVEGTVVSVDHDPYPGTDTTNVTIRVVQARSDLGTYADMQAAWQGASNETIRAAWATINGTYGDVETDPLWRGYRR